LIIRHPFVALAHIQTADPPQFLGSEQKIACRKLRCDLRDAQPYACKMHDCRARSPVRPSVGYVNLAL